jgi:hypothetical protein
MMTDTGPAADDLESVVARQKITECLLRYARGTDRCDWDLIRSAYHPDAIDHHGSALSGSPEEFIAWYAAQQPSREYSQHNILNISIDLAGDEAHVETYFVAVIRLAGGDDLRTIGGRYVDRFERRDGDWRIALRVMLSEWTTLTDVAEGTPFLAGGHRSSRDRTDVSYQRPLMGPA